MKNKRSADYDFIKIILFILVLFGHTAYYQIETNYGKMIYQSQMNTYNISNTNIHIFITNIIDYIYTFHMPAFIALSGFFFNKQMKEDKWVFKSLVVNKFKKLILPMIFVWIFWNIPIKYISGYYEGISAFGVFIQIFFPYGVYLWFIESLFIDFIIFYFINKYIKSLLYKNIIVFILFSIGIYYYYRGNPFPNPLICTLWFYIGMNIDFIIKSLKKSILYKQGIIILINILLYYTTIDLIDRYSLFGIFFEKSILAICGTIMIWQLKDTFSKFIDKNSENINKIASYGFGIYLYSDPLNYLIMYITVKLFGIKILGCETAAGILILIRFIIPLFVSVLIVKLLRKLKFQIKAY